MQTSELLTALQERFGDALKDAVLVSGELTVELAPQDLVETCTALRDERDFRFDQLIDICGVDYLDYGKDEWATEESTTTGFSRGVEPASAGRLPVLDEDLSLETPQQGRRFAAVYHLLSVANNHRLRIRVFAEDGELPVLPSVIEVWNGADWFEREAFDLFGIMFEGHPDLRRILTDYGFIGHPFRKDFPLSGNVEVRYDAEKQRVIYQPVTIEPRVLVPRVIREECPVEDPAVEDLSEASGDNEEKEEKND